MSNEHFRNQVRALLDRHRAAGKRLDGPTPAPSSQAAAASTGVCVPLRVAGVDDLQALAAVLQRVAATPALARAHEAGLLRFEVRIAEGMDMTFATSSCQTASLPGGDHGTNQEAPPPTNHCACAPVKAADGASTTTILRGVVTERDVRALPAACHHVEMAPRAVFTPLARDALRQRGITIQTPRTSPREGRSS